MQKINSTKLNQNFYQVPQELFKNAKYMCKELTLDAKMAYGILYNRLQVSIKNNWVDEDSNVYFIYSDIDLANILNVGHSTVTKIKNLLVKYGLLDMKRTGRANLLYLFEPETSEEEKEITEIQQSDTHQTATSNNNLVKPLTKKNDTKEIDTLKIEYVSKFDIFSDKNNALIKIISNNTDLEITEIKNLIFSAKKQVAHEHNWTSSKILDIKNMQELVTTTLMNTIKSLKNGDINLSKIKGYIYTAFKNNLHRLANNYDLMMMNNDLDYTHSYTDIELYDYANSLNFG